MSGPGSKKIPSIPAWQQKSYTDAQQSSTSDQATDVSSSSSELPLLEQARKFLEEESIRDASRERKVAFLEQKGLTADQIEQLLSPKQEEEASSSSSSSSVSDPSSEIKTIHDTTTHTSVDKTTTPRADTTTASTTAVPSPSETSTTSSSSSQVSSSKRDVPPIITYPEFLLKPQKPPPLVTFSRLANAAYAFAGVATLTYAASTYIVEPMLETLTSARHELASTALADLERLNTKLESTVSHVPYIPPLGSSSTSKQLKSSSDDDPPISDTSSDDSDPTELFHRDIATQTSPGRSRSSSSVSLTTSRQFGMTSSSSAAQDPTGSQSARLRSLHSTLSSLVSSTDSRFAQQRLKDTTAELQGVLDSMNNTYNPFQTDFGSSYTGSGSGAGAGAGSTLEDNKVKHKKASDNEAQKFRAEIRSLKGALLSSRNFPTARPTAPFTTAGAAR
ncbi:hypothetical protein LTS17_001327 [Exophiala oligosperma]